MMRNCEFFKIPSDQFTIADVNELWPNHHLYKNYENWNGENTTGTTSTNQNSELEEFYPKY